MKKAPTPIFGLLIQVAWGISRHGLETPHWEVTINGDTVNAVTTTIPKDNIMRTPCVWQYPICSVELMLEKKQAV
ncbi:hypothetical protein QBC33DRAFT_536406 [Phialemonium atrogriseum]|uniref:Uncharacterized protein n=1 Tax=Phialemonium atrogriseum TaxID=1093897 RepID=A0AAJ0FMB9_9PEZI|nr:uncharacterized protein QBC33DRAFT_536406 [Phialemonium atrogriseum]KAK1768163.1 hypothetical protein QBC33DRAFT_536406 [Phialemonium atrogriseum]